MKVKMVQIIPAILAKTEEEYLEKLNKLKSSTSLSSGWVQIDLMDGKFVASQSIGADVLAKTPPPFKIEAQLMVEDPQTWIDGLSSIKIDRIVFPLETKKDILPILQKIKNSHIEAGLSLNPETPIETLDSFADKIDLCLVMSVNPGFSGQTFLAETLEKIKKLKQKNYSISIEVDGGINAGVVKELVASGADSLVIGSHLMEGDFDENLEHIWEAIYS